MLTKLTIVILVLTTVFLIAYDIYAVMHGGVQSTISYVIWSYSKQFPLIPFALGLLCGHLVWQI